MAELDINRIKGNSFTEKREKIKKVSEKSVEGSVKIKKKSGLKKAASSFFGEDIVDLRGYLIHEILIPAGKDLLCDVVESLTGRSSSRRRSSLLDRNRKGKSRVSYEKAYERNHRKRGTRDSRGSMEIDDIYLESRGDCETVIDYITDLIIDYQCASVADLYGFLGEHSTHTDEKYGWYDFRDAKIRRTRDDEYLLLLPRAEWLED